MAPLLLSFFLSFFLTGMCAARLPPQSKVQALVKDLTEGGVRFVFTSERNYKGTRPMAARMGLETGWNCAISLKARPRNTLDQGSLDIHRPHKSGEAPLRNKRGSPIRFGSLVASDHATMMDDELQDHDSREEEHEAGEADLWDAWSPWFEGDRGVLTEREWEMRLNYQDTGAWDMKARLPHGIREIRQHLKDTDNVPLLVPLFTESRPQAVGGMMRVMQEYGEVSSMFPRQTSLLLIGCGSM